LPVNFNWTCPYCDHAATITDTNYSNDCHVYKEKGDISVGIWTTVITCPNEKCRDRTIKARLQPATYGGANMRAVPTGKVIEAWNLKPRSNAKPFPDYIPKPLRDDYTEACLIADLSPKASATLCRRCLQGIIRDFWGITKPKLFDEIDALKTAIDPSTWAAIDAVRKIGNIGAHMEKDVNIVIDVEPEEAQLLIALIETLFKDCYIARHDRTEHLNAIVAAAQKKDAAKAAPASPPAATK
jgi:hypothetical protein